MSAQPVVVPAIGGGLLAGKLYGRGRHGVVLFHESDTSSVVWSGFASRLATADRLVLALDSRGHGGSTDSALGEPGPDSHYGSDGLAAAMWIRSRGAQDLALVGASIGGTMALVTAENRQAGVHAVVSLSGPAGDGGQLNAIAGAASAPRHVLLVVGSHDTDFTGDLEALADAMPQARKLILDGSSDHGTALLERRSGSGVTVADAVAQFLDHALSDEQRPSSTPSLSHTAP
jgi:dienelactone hydrolase